jgi:hypothetical protein
MVCLCLPITECVTTIGGFIYIAGSDVLPELYKETKPLRSGLQLLVAAIGVGIMLLLTRIE